MKLWRIRRPGLRMHRCPECVRIVVDIATDNWPLLAGCQSCRVAWLPWQAWRFRTYGWQLWRFYRPEDVHQ